MRTFFLIWIVGFTIQKAAAQTFVSSNQQWLHYYLQADINEKNRVGFDAGFRFKNEFAEPSQFLTRISYSKKLKPSFSVGGGFVFSGYFDFGILERKEFRPYQEFLYLHKWKKSNIQTRYRLEERFYSDRNDPDLNQNHFVLRNRFSFSYSFLVVKPFRKKENTSLWFQICDEVFINAPLNKTTNWFDQNRIMAGPVLKLKKDMSLQFLYNLQISSMSQESTFKVTHVFWLRFRHAVDFVR